jgi:thiopurine S-methyltransferase
MELQYWYKKWENEDIGFHNDRTNPVLLNFIEKFISYQNNIESSCLIPLCGKSKDLLFLKEFFKQITGVELVKKAIDDFFSENQLKANVFKDTYKYENLEIINHNIFDLPKSNKKKFKYIYDRAAIIALPEKKRRSYVNSLKDLMDNTCTILMITIEYSSQSVVGPPFSVSKKEIQEYFKGFSIDEVHHEKLVSALSKFKDIQITQKVYIINKC